MGIAERFLRRRIGTLHAIVKSPFIYFNAPWYTKAFSPKSSLTDLLSSGLNNPNTDEPDPVIAAYTALPHTASL